MTARRTGWLLATVLAAVLLQGCNTVAGIGKDVKSAGSALEGEAEEN